MQKSFVVILRQPLIFFNRNSPSHYRYSPKKCRSILLPRSMVKTVNETRSDRINWGATL